MPKKRRKKKRKPKTKKPQSGISESANPIRFLVMLAIGLILLAILYYFAVVTGGWGSIDQELPGF